MEVVRLHSGYRIRCTNGEFEALRIMAELAVPLTAEKENRKRFTGRAKGAVQSERFQRQDGPLSVIDDDRREPGA